MHIQLISQVIPALIYCMSSRVTMEPAFLCVVCVMAMMTVEITVMKMDVSDGKWIFYKALILEQSTNPRYVMATCMPIFEKTYTLMKCIVSL